MAFPAFIPEPVVVFGVAVEADMEPVFVGAVPLFLPHVLESPEASAHVIEHAVQHDAQTSLMQRRAKDVYKRQAGWPAG